MNWEFVHEWLKSHGHVNENWDCVAVGEDSFYAEDKAENTFISLFTRGGSELIAVVGMNHPKLSVGGSTGVEVFSHEDVIYFLEDNLEYFYDELMRKVVEKNG